GQPGNIVRSEHWSLIAGLLRFFRTAEERVAAYPAGIALGDFLAAEGYSDAFVDRHIVPMGAAIWSTPIEQMLSFPAQSFIRFYGNHGMLQARNRPAWRTVSGGSRRYVERILGDSRIEICHGQMIRKVGRTRQCAHLEDERGVVRIFDHVVIAAHADQALAMLADADSEESRLLGAFRYQRNRAYLHRDARWMPARRRVWSSWNYLKRETRGEDAL